MNGKKSNILILIENGQLKEICLDDRTQWEIGRGSKSSMPDIRLYSATISRKHGKFQSMDGVWFYLDYNGKNGTVYNHEPIVPGINGRVKPVILSDGDKFVFGGGMTAWAMYMDRAVEGAWNLVDTKGFEKVMFVDGDNKTVIDRPDKGTVVEKENGIAIYMGDISFTIGDIKIQNN